MKATFKAELRQTLLRGWIPRSLGLVFCVLFGMPGIVLAEGTQTGVLVGTVLGPSGQPLQQVPVTLQGSQGAQQVLTDGLGTFRFPALQVGTYRASAELLGMRGAEEVQVFIDRTSELTLSLATQTSQETTGAADAASSNSEADGETETVDSLDSVETLTSRSIQVVAMAPLLDRFETRVESSVGRELLEDLPVERFYQSVALLLPGVAGGGDGNPNVSGARRSNNLFLVDGVDTTDPTTQLFGLNLSYEAVDEVAVTVAALPVEWGRVSGAPINVVTQSGGKTFHGSGRVLASGGSLSGDYRDPEPTLAPEIRAANDSASQVDPTVAATLSGPLLPRNLWFFAAFEWGEGELTRPTLEGSRWNDSATQRTGVLKLSAQPADAHSLMGQLTADAADFIGFSIFDRSPAENRVGGLPRQLSNMSLDRLPGDLFALQDNSQRGDFTRLSWQWVATQNLVVSTAAARQQRRLERNLENRRDVTGGAPHVGDNPALDFNGLPIPGEQTSAVFNGITDEGFEDREREQGNISATVYGRGLGGEHEVRFGLDAQRTRSEAKLNFSGLDGVDPFTGRAVEGQLYFDTDDRDPCFFDGQCVAFDPATGVFQPDMVLNFWRRGVQSTEMETLAVYASENFSLGRWLFSLGARYESVRGTGGGRDLVRDDAVAPRLGIKLDPWKSGRTLLSATYGRFYESFPQAFLDSFVQPAELSGFTEYQWAGIFGDDCSGQDPADLTSSCWEPVDEVPFSPLQFAAPNLNLRRSSVDEITVGLEHQLSSDTDLRVTYVDRTWDNLWDDLLEEGTDDLGDFVEFDLQNLPQARRTYEALMVLVRKRYAERWQLLGSYTWSRAEGNLFEASGRATFADFHTTSDTNVVNRFGPAPYDRTHQVKLFTSYRAPFGRGHLTVGSALRYEDGTPFQQEMLEDLGTRFLTPRGSERLDALHQIDLSFGLDWTTRDGFEVLAKLELFNLTDESTRLGAETDVESGIFGAPRSLADLQRPRSLRLTLGFRR